MRLAPGKSASEMYAWFLSPKGPPPGEPIGGVFAIRPDQHAFVTIDFTPGEYALICFVQDAKDGKMHADHGMIRQVTVK